MTPLILVVVAAAPLAPTPLPPQEYVGAASAPALDHVVLVVHDLDRASAPFRRHGFRLKPGRLHANNLLNRHIKFQDGSSIELMTIEGEPGDPVAQRYVDLLTAGEGGLYVALTVGSASDTDRVARALGLEPRRRASGPWRFVSFPPASPAASVFFSAGGVAVEDPDSLVSHRPDVAGLSEVWLEGGAELGALLEGLGAERCGPAHSPEGLAGERFGLSRGTLVIVPPRRTDGPRVLGAVLRSRTTGERTIRPHPRFWVRYR